MTDAHKQGVYDPMTATLLRVPGTGDPLSPEACRTGAAVFDGRMRYELKLDYKRMEMVKADKGYRGPGVVCAVYFTPIAGYIPDRPVIKYLSRPAQHRDHLRAARRYPHPGAVPDDGADPARHRDAGSHPVRDPGRAAARRQDAVGETQSSETR